MRFQSLEALQRQQEHFMDQSLPPTDAAVINKSNDYFALVQKS